MAAKEASNILENRTPLNSPLDAIVKNILYFASTLRLLFFSLLGTGTSLASEQPYPQPSITPSGIETAFIANQNDFYVYSVIYAYDDGPQCRTTNSETGAFTCENSNSMTVDGGVGLGIGLGSSKDLIGLQIGYNFLGFRDENIGGTIDVKVARDLVSNENLRISLAGGALGLIGHGKGLDDGITPFLVTSVATPVEIFSEQRTVQFNFGYGGGKFQEVRSPEVIQEGLFGSLGLELSDNVGVSAGWAGRGVNTTLSVSPVRGLPIGINISAENVTNYNDLGRAYSLSLVWGGNFRSAF